MRGPIVLASAGLAIMAGALVYGFSRGGGWDEIGELMAYPWFVVSLVDVYVGFALFGAWVAFRERIVAAVVWIVLILALGNLAACLYALLALLTARGDWSRFWLGRRAAQLRATG